jgi:preprotein translocase subunit YajC
MGDGVAVIPGLEVWGPLSLAMVQGDSPSAGAAPLASDGAPGVPGSVGSEQGVLGPGGAQGVSSPAAPPSLWSSPLVLVFGMLLIIMLTTVLGGRKEKKRRAELLSSLKRQDRVQTMGGIIGTIVEMKDDEVVLRVDEGTNTRIRFARSAIQQVLRESSAKESPQVEGKPVEKVSV